MTQSPTSMRTPVAKRRRPSSLAYHRQYAFDAQDGEDQGLTEDEEEAGALWAKDHRPTGFDQCPTCPTAFRKGCADYLRLMRR